MLLMNRNSGFQLIAALTPPPLSLRELFQSQRERGSFIELSTAPKTLNTQHQQH